MATLSSLEYGSTCKNRKRKTVYQCFVNIDLFRRILIPYNVNKHVYVPVTYVGRCILIIISNSMCLGVRRPFS